MHLNGAVQELWLHEKLASTMEILSHDVVLNGKSHHAYANRAILQARFKNWNDALIDAEMVTRHALPQSVTLKDFYFQSIDIQPSVIGCIAKSIALCGQGRHEDSMQAFDLAFSYCSAEEVNYLLLVKVLPNDFQVSIIHHSVSVSCPIPFRAPPTLRCTRD